MSMQKDTDRFAGTQYAGTGGVKPSRSMSASADRQTARYARFASQQADSEKRIADKLAAKSQRISDRRTKLQAEYADNPEALKNRMAVLDKKQSNITKRATVQREGLAARKTAFDARSQKRTNSLWPSASSMTGSSTQVVGEPTTSARETAQYKG